jgi:hypothetical protein
MANTSVAGYLHGVVPFPPMEAELVRELPEGDGWQYEPEGCGRTMQRHMGSLCVNAADDEPCDAATDSPGLDRL